MWRATLSWEGLYALSIAPDEPSRAAVLGALPICAALAFELLSSSEVAP